ncbi:MAG: HEAT repeat domain-containing protein [Elusimicrobia bacterium]|nr:HEAT repeat domain-containing protein [Elusimicrobiota bacterium]
MKTRIISNIIISTVLLSANIVYGADPGSFLQKQSIPSVSKKNQTQGQTGASGMQMESGSQKKSAKNEVSTAKKTNVIEKASAIEKTSTSVVNVSEAIVNPKTPFESALDNIKSDDPNIRRMGAVEFSRLRDKRAVEPLLKILKDKNAGVRTAAIDALGLLRAKEALVEISELLIKDPDESVRHTAAISLSYIGGMEAGEALIKAMDDKSVGVKYAAIRTIAVLRYTKAEAKLIKLLTNEDVNMRRSVINTLGQIRSIKSAKGISEYYNDKDIYTRREVAKALGEIGDEERCPILKNMLKDDEETVQIEAAYALAKMKDDSGLDRAHKFIKSSDRLLKQNSSSIIALVGNEKSLKVLEDAYKIEDDPNTKSFMNFSKERLLSRLKLEKKK